MLKADTLAGRKADGTVALPSHLSPEHRNDIGAKKGDFGHCPEK